MSRRFGLLTLAVIAVVVGGAHLRSRPKGDGTPVSATVWQLWQNTDAYKGELVRTEGVPRVFSPGTADEYFVVEQAGQYRVGVRGIERSALEPLVGQRVQVEGVMRLTSDFGVSIDATSVSPRLPATPFRA